MTRMACAFTSVESRCEIMITVRPTAMRDRLLMKIASLSGSSALAASSVRVQLNHHLVLQLGAYAAQQS